MLGVAAQAQAQTKSFDIDGGDLKVALDRYLAQSGMQLIYKVGVRTVDMSIKIPF